MEPNNKNDHNDSFSSSLNARDSNAGEVREGNNWSRSANHRYGRDNASMRGNDFYGDQGINSDYGRGNYSNSTFGAGARGGYSAGTRSGGTSYGQSRYGSSRTQGGYSGHRNGLQSESARSGYGDYSSLGNRNNYGRQAPSQSYTDFINYNYGNRSSYGGSNRSGHKGGYDNSIGNFGNTGYGSTRYNNRDKDRLASAYGSANEGTPYKADPKSNYSENDGRRR